MSVSEEIIEKLRDLHAEVDLLAASLADRLDSVLARGLVCRRGCSDCCVDDLNVFPVEASLITANAGELLVSSDPHPIGRCAFLDESGSCRIYPWRPYVCRTQGLPLRWLEEGCDGAVAELRDICPLNDELFKETNKSLTDLTEDQCWTIGGFEGRLAGLQASVTGFSDEPSRLALRSLFERKP